MQRNYFYTAIVPDEIIIIRVKGVERKVLVLFIP